MPTITPFLWFDCDLAEPIRFYTSIFPDSAAPDLGPDDGTIPAATIELCGQRLMLLNGGPALPGFNEAISLFVSVETQEEIDEAARQLAAGRSAPFAK